MSSGTKSKLTMFLRAQERTQRRSSHSLPHQAHAFPRILLQEADTDVELDRGDHFDPLKSDLIHFLGYRQHVRRRHSGRP
jgi:hypothetical protein